MGSLVSTRVLMILDLLEDESVEDILACITNQVDRGFPIRF